MFTCVCLMHCGLVMLRLKVFVFCVYGDKVQFKCFKMVQVACFYNLPNPRYGPLNTSTSKTVIIAIVPSLTISKYSRQRRKFRILFQQK